MNDDASTFELPSTFIPASAQIFIDFPERDEELWILKTNLLLPKRRSWSTWWIFSRIAHEMEERYSVRDGINIARYALKRLVEKGSA